MEGEEEDEGEVEGEVKVEPLEGEVKVGPLEGEVEGEHRAEEEMRREREREEDGVAGEGKDVGGEEVGAHGGIHTVSPCYHQ